MDFYALDQHIKEEQEKKAKSESLDEGFWGDLAGQAANFGKRAMWGQQATDGSRPMANWSFNDRLKNWSQPPENRVDVDQLRQNQLDAQGGGQDAGQGMEAPSSGDQGMDQLAALLPKVAQAIYQVKDPGMQAQLKQQYQTLATSMASSPITAQAPQDQVGSTHTTQDSTNDTPGQSPEVAASTSQTQINPAQSQVSQGSQAAQGTTQAQVSQPDGSGSNTGQAYNTQFPGNPQDYGSGPITVGAGQPDPRQQQKRRQS